MRKFHLGILYIIPLVASFVVSCSKGSHDTGRPSEEGEDIPGYLTDYRLKCSPIGEIRENQPVLMGCSLVDKDGKPYKGSLEGIKIVVTDADGNEKVISDITILPDQETWQVSFQVPEDQANSIVEIKSSVIVKGTPQTNVSAMCPIGFILIPGSTVYKTSDFCLMKYEAKKADSGDKKKVRVNVSGALASASEGYIYVAAKEACETLGKGFHLITNAEWMTVAIDIAGNKNNWSGDEVGKGAINAGHSDNLPSIPIPNVSLDDDPCFATLNGRCNDKSHGDWSQKRTHSISNGEIIWDFSGNEKEWVDANIAKLDELPLPHGGDFSEINKIEATATSISVADVHPLKRDFSWWEDSWNINNGIGRYYVGSTTTMAITRGGDAFSGDGSGIFYFAAAPIDYSVPNVGFRCSYTRP